MRKDGRRSDEVMPMREAPVGHGNGGPIETVSGEDYVIDNRPLSSAQVGPAMSGNTGPDNDTREIGSAVRQRDQTVQERLQRKRAQVKREMKHGSGSSSPGYPGTYRPKSDRERN